MAITEAPQQGERAIPAAKGSELVALALATLAALVLASLVSHQPSDPSFLHELPGRDPAIDNWIGAVGAQLSALFFGLLGVAAFLLPLGAGALAWRIFRRDGSSSAECGLGFLLLAAATPVLLHLLVGTVPWRGASMAAGGVLGSFVGEAMLTRLNFFGSLLVSAAILVAGAMLLVPSTMGHVLSRWSGRLRDRVELLRMLWIRGRQRRDKERLRERVVAKHLRRREAEAEEDSGTGSDAHGDLPDLPLRVEEKEGRGSFSVRKVAAKRKSASEPGEPPQAELFEGEVGEAELPPLNLLVLERSEQVIAENALLRLGETIRERCEEFGVEGEVEEIHPGPVITVFEFKPAPGVKMSQIVNLEDDLALALKAESVRIDRIPGRSTLGIEVPNSERATIRLGHLLAKDGFQSTPSPLTIAVGTDVHGKPYYADLATMPHLLVAGATGSGKSVALQSMITSILYKATRDEVQFILIDPKRVELGVYRDIPHLKTEVVIDAKKAANALRWAVAEMERRYRLLAEVHVRSLDYYNRAIRDPEVQKRLRLDDESELADEELKPLPYYVIVVDELADLMMVAASEVEGSIARLAQMARAVGIHLILATQRPSVDVITGTIKANFPCRMSFATTSRTDSRTILDQNGAEQLLGDGDLLFMPPTSSRLVRLHGAYISEQETAALIRWLKRVGSPDLDPEVVEYSEAEDTDVPDLEPGDDELYEEAARIVVAEQKGSASYLQRRLRVGFTRAARLIDIMEQEGLVGPPQGSKPRDVLVDESYFEELETVEG